MNEARIKMLELDVEQLHRALTNQNLAASQQGSEANKGALRRIEQKQKEIESLRKQSEPKSKPKSKAKKTAKRKKK